MAATETLTKPLYGLSPKQRDMLLRIGTPLVIALAGFAIVLAAYGKNPLATYWDVLHGTFGSTRGFTEVLVIMIPLMFCALSVAIPARIGMVNVGGEGQLYLGAIFAAYAPLPRASFLSGIPNRSTAPIPKARAPSASLTNSSTES